MKHKVAITIILLGMFLITQVIGLFVVNHYLQPDNDLPLGLQTPELEKEKDFYSVFPSIIIAFIIAIVLFFLLTRFKIEIILKIWFLLVVILALAISINTFFPKLSYAMWIALAIAIPLGLLKMFHRHVLIHNVTELLIYPGVAAIFVPILNVWTLVILLVIISLYDAWAVWHSKIMQKMAKYQMNTLKVFGGFFVPYLSKAQRAKIKKMKKSDLKKKGKGMKVNVAILGGGDVVFPIISAGVMLKFFNIWAAVLVIAGAFLGLGALLMFSKKKKFYPAMPFISAGIFLGMLISWIIF